MNSVCSPPPDRRESFRRALAITALASFVMGAVAFTTCVAQADPLFVPPFVNYETGGHAYSVAIGDLNGDGKPDLVTANWYYTVSVLLGTGDGTFGAKTDFAAGSYPNCVAIGDMNGDGKPDLVTSNNSVNTVSVLLGIGDGTFGAKTEFATGLYPTCVAIADLNRDGKLDVAAASTNSSTVSVLLGNGAGALGAKTSFATGVGTCFVAIGDLNGDGVPDLVAANSDAYSVSVLFGNGDGTFGAKTDFGTGAKARSVAIGDVNGDGHPDLVTANEYAGTVSVLLNTGSGTFGTKTDYATGVYPYSAAIGDLDGDGRPDLAVANLNSGSVSVLPGNGDGTFAAKTDFVTTARARSIAIADLNGDGRLDLAVANDAPAGTVTVLLNGTPGPPTPTLVELFRAVPTDLGVRIEWQLSDPSAFQSIALHRSIAETGPWSPVQQTPQTRGQVTSVLDDVAAAGQTHWYRLSGVQRDGHLSTLGLTSALVQEAITAFALLPLSPNPCTGRSLVTFAIPTRTGVRLTLTDVQGREVALLADGIREAGRYAAALDAGDLPAGVYFVRMQAKGVNLTRRVVVVR